MLAPLKLTAGQAWAAWRDFPARRRELARPAPGPPILVTGMYRTGTTWVGAMLTAAGLWPLHEPFNPNQGLWQEELAYAAARAPRPEVDALVAELLEGRHRKVVRIPYAARWFSPLRLLRRAPRRVLLKDPSAALLSEYLVRRHGMRALVLFRHPAAVTASFVRLGWPTGRLVERLLSSEALMEEWLAPRTPVMESVLDRRDWVSGAVLYACVAEVLIGFTHRNAGEMTRLTFEDLCADPVARFRDLHGILGLPWDEGVRRAHADMTEGPDDDPEADPHGVRRTSVALAGRWRGRVTETDLGLVREVWEQFDLPLYRSPEDWESPAEGSA